LGETRIVTPSSSDIRAIGQAVDDAKCKRL
jgi:hypothetical protein